MLERAKFLRRAGYGVLLYDAQAHGESPGDHITFGYLESEDARAAVAFAKDRRPKERIGFLGVSLGGASALLGSSPIGVSALVLEAVYPRLPDAVANRIAIRLGPLGRYLAPLLLWQAKPRLGFDPEDLNPIDSIGRVGAPLLVVAGSEDAHTPLQESRELYRAAREPKQLWVIDGAAHVNFHGFARQEYERQVLDFFNRYLRSGAARDRAA